jgi:L-lactate dehydrogenase complex protein LldG
MRPSTDGARAEILGRLRAALGSSPGTSAPSEPPESRFGYRRSGDRSAEQRRAIFTDRLEDYRARVVPCGHEWHEITEAIQGVLEEHGAETVVAPERVATAWLGSSHEPDGPGPRVLVDHAGLAAADLADVDAVVTGCALGIAETGVIVLDGDAWSGRRLISLVPDVHVCVVTLDQVVDLPPEAVERLDPRAPQTWIAGPSATSDIELERVEGVHGPRTLIVLVAG